MNQAEVGKLINQMRFKVQPKAWKLRDNSNLNQGNYLFIIINCYVSLLVVSYSLKLGVWPDDISKPDLCIIPTYFSLCIIPPCISPTASLCIL